MSLLSRIRDLESRVLSLEAREDPLVVDDEAPALLDQEPWLMDRAAQSTQPLPYRSRRALDEPLPIWRV